jgi:APA family basic amino acid/polyamine antiporter
MPPAALPPKPQLVRALGRWSLVALVLNGIIGSGIFGLPSAIAKFVGADALWAYLAGALGIGVIMAVFAELSSQYRETGGQYLWARDALGRFAGIQTGWFVWLVRVTSGAAVINLFVTYLGEFWPGATQPVARALLMTAIVASFTAVNIRGVRAGAGLSTFFIVVKLTSLALFIVVGVWLVPHHVPPANVVAPSANAWIDALVATVFAYGGFESAVIPAAEAKDPRRDMPFALLSALGVVTVFFILVHLVAMWSLPALATSARPLADAARIFAGDTGARVIALAAMISTIGWVSAAFVAVPRLTYALAENGDFPSVFSRVHARFRTPYVSILLWSVAVLALAIQFNFLWSAILSAAARLVTFVITCLALLKLRRARPNADAWRAPAGALLAVLGLAFCALLIVRLTRDQANVMGAVAILAALNWTAVRRSGRAR